MGAWCREHAAPGALLVAPSAGARRRAVRHVVAARGVTLGLKVVTPGRLVALLEARAGLAPTKLISPALERLLVTEAARAARVPLFDDADSPSGAVRAVTTLIRSLRMNGISPALYAAAGGDPRAADAYARFESRRVRLGLDDGASRIARLLDSGVPSVRLVLDDPALPDRATLDLYAAVIAASPSCHVGVSDLSADGPASRVIGRFAAMGFAVERPEGDLPLSAPAVRAIGGAGMYDEVELTAREMLALLRSRRDVRASGAPGGCRAVRPGDVLGVAPSRVYLDLLHDACVRLGIPVASPRRLDVLDVPLVRAVLQAFRLLSDPQANSPEQGLALLATPYMGLRLDEHDRIARDLTLRALGSLGSWTSSAAGMGRPGFRRFVESVPRLTAQLEGERSHREMAGVITALGLECRFLAHGRRAHLAAGCDDVVRIDQQGWDALTKAIDELGDALRIAGITRLSASRWLAELTEVLAGARVRVDAKGRDGVRLTITGAGLSSAPHVFAVGWREGLVPRRVREDPLLPDRVKRALNERGALFTLMPDRTGRDHERRERVVRAAQESLTISWPAVDDDGDPLLPSFYLDDLGVTDRKARGVGDTTWPLPLAASRGERIARATLLARHRPAAALGDELEAVRETLSTLTAGERRAYSGALHAGQRIELPRDVIDEATPLASVMSASQARMVAHCLYEHFGSKRLGLQPLSAPTIDALLIGSVAHGILAELGRCGFDEAMLDGLAEKWWRQKTPAALFDQPGARFERDLLLSQLRDLAAAERAYLCEGEVRATHFELAFGSMGDDHDTASTGEGSVIALPHGSAIDASTLRGSIDRVDVVTRDGQLYGVAIDYKTGKGESYRKEMEEMADFQLPIYCGVLPVFGIEPVGALYLGVASGERHGVLREDFADAFALRDDRNVKKLTADVFRAFMLERREALGMEIARVARGDLVVKPRKDDCKYCELRPVCRIGTFGVGDGGARDDE